LKGFGIIVIVNHFNNALRSSSGRRRITERTFPNPPLFGRGRKAWGRDEFYSSDSNFEQCQKNSKMKRKKLPKSLRKYIRKEKSRIRREILDIKEREKRIKELIQSFSKTT